MPGRGDYPVPGLGGTLSQVWEGLPCARSRGVPHPRSGGVLCPRSGDTPSQAQVWGVYPIQGPGGGVPHPDLVTGVPQVPPARPGMGYLPRPDLGWGTPLARPRMGYPPWPDLGWGTPYSIVISWETQIFVTSHTKGVAEVAKML